MTFSQLTKERVSVRAYEERPVEQEKLDKILEAARIAPTAANFQPVRLFVVQSKEGLNKVSITANIFHAPVAIIVCADKTKAWVRPVDGMITTDIDASILTTHLMLATTEQGLGSVWICYFDPNVLKNEFNLPKELEPINILALGYSAQPAPDPNRHTIRRMKIEELVEYI